MSAPHSLSSELMTDSDFQDLTRLIRSLRRDAEQSLIQKRAAKHKDDPLEELNEIYVDIKETETKLHKSIDLAEFLMGKHLELTRSAADQEAELTITTK